MGIPRFTTYISPYAVTTVLGCDKPACGKHSSSVTNRSNKIIIDGPAFAYTIYDRLIAHKPGHLDALAAVPSYDEVEKAAVAFLCESEKRGIIMYGQIRFGISIPDKVYFDGFLPLQKKDTRISRLNKQVERLSTFHSLHQSGFCDTAQDRETPGSKLSGILNPSCPQSAFRSLPAAPFFVAAVLEAIGNSKYASITEVVPGEADAYCAAMARQIGGTILSNDSDLLIYDLGLFGTIGSLTNLGMNTRATQSKVDALGACLFVQTTVVRPRDVAHSLGLENLKKLAYVLKEDSEVPFQKAVQKAQRLNLSGTHFQEILGEYIIDPTAFESCMFRQEILARIRAQSPSLDPRISEFVLQSDGQSASIYLPVMIEDPNRTSAFAVSNYQRRFAYSCCTLAYKVKDRKVLEYGRKGRKILPTSIPLLSDVEILEHAKDLRMRLRHFKSSYSVFPKLLIWRTCALAEAYHWYLDTARAPPSRDNMTTVITGKAMGRITWGDVHLCAQIEASLYSLRMTQQILGFVLPFAPSDETEISILEILLRLKEELKDLLPLKYLMPSRSELVAQTADLDVDELLNLLASTLQNDLRQEGLEKGVDDEEGETGEHSDVTSGSSSSPT